MHKHFILFLVFEMSFCNSVNFTPDIWQLMEPVLVYKATAQLQTFMIDMPSILLAKIQYRIIIYYIKLWF